MKKKRNIFMKAMSVLLCAATIVMTAVPALASEYAYAKTIHSPSDYVTQLYRGFLGREPDSSGLNSWTKALISGKETGCSVAVKFANSKEFQKRISANSTDERYYYIFMAIYGNQPDWNEDHSACMSYNDYEMTWTMTFPCKVVDGRCSFDKFLEEILNTAQMTAVCKAAGITKGTYKSNHILDRNPELTSFVQTLYLEFLNRPTNNPGLYTYYLPMKASEVEPWVSVLVNKKKTATQVVRAFMNSKEYANAKYANWRTNEEFIKDVYVAILGREADASGLKTWTNALNSGKSRTAVVDGLLASAEFARRCSKLGIAK